MADYKYHNPDDAPAYTKFSRYDEDFEEDEGRGEIGLEDFELEKICSEVLRMVRLATYAVRMEHEEVLINRKKKQDASNGSATIGRLEYLSAKHLNTDKANESSVFTIMWAGTPEAAEIGNKFNALVAVKVQRKTSGQRYWWMLSADNPNLDVLCDALSEDSTKWVEHDVLIYLEKKMPSETLFVRSEVVPAESKKAAAGK